MTVPVREKKKKKKTPSINSKTQRIVSKKKKS